MSDEQGVAGVGFLIAAFTEENAADQALAEMKKAKKADEFYYDDAAVIRQDAEGKVHVKETGDMTTGKGAGIGALVGGVIGILGGPAGIAFGAGAGAAIGAAAAHGDAGFDNKNLEELGGALQPGTSALVATTSKAFVEAMRKERVSDAEMDEALGNVADEVTDRLAEGKNVVLGLLLTEEGVAVKEVTADDESVEVMGLVATEEGLVFAAAVVTDDGAAYEIGVATEEGVAVEAGVITDEAAVIATAVAVPVEEGADEIAEGEADEAADAEANADEDSGTKES